MIQPLTKEQLYKKVPSVFATQPSETRSERYGFIPTIKIIETLEKEGFLPFSAIQAGTRNAEKMFFTKHIIRFRYKNDYEKKEWEEVPEIVMVNSHDGTSTYNMMAGVFRIVCTNGLIAGNFTNEIRIKHNGENLSEEITNSAYEISKSFPEIMSKIDTMKSISLTEDDKLSFAEAAMVIKYDEKPPIKPADLLIPRRIGDSKNDLWTNFNIIQENLIKGGQKGYTAETLRRTKTRPVKSIEADIKLNKALWILTERMASIKNNAIAA